MTSGSSGSNAAPFVSPIPEPVGQRIEVTPAAMAAILEGIDLSAARRQRRFAPATATAPV